MTVDIVVVPLRFTLEAYAQLDILFSTVTIYRGYLWEWALPSFKGRLATVDLSDKDKASPTFATDNRAVSKRNAAGGCEVFQIKDRTIEDPAFQINVAADSETSKLVYEYKVGDYPGKSKHSLCMCMGTK